jgi:hypothetical protein
VFPSPGTGAAAAARRARSTGRGCGASAAASRPTAAPAGSRRRWPQSSRWTTSTTGSASLPCMNSSDSAQRNATSHRSQLKSPVANWMPLLIIRSPPGLRAEPLLAIRKLQRCRDSHSLISHSDMNVYHKRRIVHLHRTQETAQVVQSMLGDFFDVVPVDAEAVLLGSVPELEGADGALVDWSPRYASSSHCCASA